MNRLKNAYFHWIFNATLVCWLKFQVFTTSHKYSLNITNHHLLGNQWSTTPVVGEWALSVGEFGTFFHQGLLPSDLSTIPTPEASGVISNTRSRVELDGQLTRMKNVSPSTVHRLRTWTSQAPFPLPKCSCTTWPILGIRGDHLSNLVSSVTLSSCFWSF